MNPQVWSSEHNDTSDFDTIENEDEDCIPDVRISPDKKSFIREE